MNQFELALQQRAGAEETQQGLILQSRGGVRALDTRAAFLNYLVADRTPQSVVLRAAGPQCGCELFRERGACRHVVAALAEARAAGLLDEMLHRQALRNGESLLDAVETVHASGRSIRLEVLLRLEPESGALQAGLRVGEDRLYVVRSMPQFFEALRTGEPLSFGKGFTLQTDWMCLEPAVAPAVQVLRAICETLSAADALPKGAQARWLPLTDPSAHTLLQALRRQPFRLVRGEENYAVPGIREVLLPLRFQVSDSLRGLKIAASLPPELQPLTEDCRFLFTGETVVETDAGQRALLPVLLRSQTEGRCEFAFPADALARTVPDLLPALYLAGAVELSPGVQRRLVREPLSARVYLDRADSDVTARVSFRYGETDVNPFEPAAAQTNLQHEDRLLLRDALAERQVLDALDAAGFSVRRGFARLSGQESIFRFITEGVAELQTRCEVFLSHDFRRITPRRPTLSGRLGLRDGKLLLQLSDDGEVTGEALAILRALAQRRRYFRLENGAFLDLSGLERWQEAAQAIVQDQPETAPAGDGVLLDRSRSVYLSLLLRDTALPVDQSAEVRGMVRALQDGGIPLPENADLTPLRPYQQTGLKWLYTLDQLGMGGILADDMGLGKTIQLIALLRCVRAPGEVSLVVAPTSLTYNWYRELQRFAPELSAAVCAGPSAAREQLLRHIREYQDLDVLITSYPLVRRDLHLLQEMEFRVVALDEAQQIKNAGSVGAVAVRQLRAHSRFALTGTPLENHVGELWSLTDFVLPGYLGTYTSFMRRYQEGREAEDLRRRLRPFLLRRLKRDVLTELPDKLEYMLTAQMTPEQEQVYQAARLRLSSKVDHVLREKGLSRGRIEVLSAITELRQICCHPSLVLEHYTGGSGKIALLGDLLPQARAAGQRALLFSQFTGMLRILRRQLEAEGLHCLYLDGETPAAQRLQLCEAFNAGEGDVFLISLRAGGTGLNLTGADLVVHYDPWWNPAVEDQATDRAHRIGQTHKVEVLRLITHGTIEEQVMALGERKRKLFDRLITPGEELITALTEKDIRQLFS